jgi:hypothetical protein
MAFTKIRIWNGFQMNYFDYRWEDSFPMDCTNHQDKNGNLIYENDILKYKKYIAILKKGEFNYNGSLQYGWYLECYCHNNKSIQPFYINNKEYEIIGNIYKNYNLYEQLKTKKWSDRIGFVG